MSDFTFLRPQWLIALALVPLLPWLLRRARRAAASWQRAIDAHLLPHLLERAAARVASIAPALVVATATIAIVALAGPSLKRTTTPLREVEAPLVVALDLSSAMNAADLPPSRLVQARAKIAALLDTRRGGQVGLIAFADDAFSVAPITSDARTVAALLDSLATDIMPVDGQRADRAIDRAVKLMRNAGFDSGDVLLVTDHADGEAQAAATRARAAGFRVGALGVGTATGAPASGSRGFATGPDGRLELARLDTASLDALARAGGGRHADLVEGDADLRALDVLDPRRAESRDAATPAEAALARSDDGYWLLPPLMLVALFGFRRGWLALVPLALAPFVLMMGLASPARADGWDSLWRRDDQRARAALDRGDAATARELAPDPALRGAAAFRGNDFDAAAKSFAERDDADAHYNRGNALAKAGHYQEAISAYDDALQRAPGMDDAVANRAAVEAMLKQQQNQQQQQQQNQKQQQDPQKRQQQQDQQQQQQQKDGQPKSEEQPQQQRSQSGDEKKDEKKSDQEVAAAAKPADAKDQQAANEAQKREMQKALDEARQDPQQKPAAAARSDKDRAEDEQRQALEQWMRRVPDDPGALLRRRFALEHQRRQKSGENP